MKKPNHNSSDTSAKLSLRELEKANSRLKEEILLREKAEAELKKSESHYVKLFEQSLLMQNQLRHLSRQLLIAQEEERKRISRELHDEIVQTLVGINVHLSSLKIKTQLNTKELVKKITQTQRLVEKSINIVHRFARELRPTVLDDLGLIPALKHFFNEFTKRTKIKIDLTVTPGVEQLSNTQRTVLYRVAQSALTNVKKHAKASEVKFSLAKERGSVLMIIHDNGRSFSVDAVLFAQKYQRLGLLGSRERVEMIGGKFTVESAPGMGTKVTAEIPLRQKLTK